MHYTIQTFYTTCVLAEVAVVLYNSVLSTCVSWLHCILYCTTNILVYMSELPANKIQFNLNKSLKNKH